MCSLSSLAALIAASVGSPVAVSDPVGQTLRATGLVHTDIGGFYQLRYDYTESKRGQVAYIRQRVDTYNSLSVQEAYSIFYESKTAPDTEVLRKIFQKSFTIGGLVLEEPSEKQEFWRIRFKIDVPTASTPERLKEYMSFVAGTADGIEKELGPEDRL